MPPLIAYAMAAAAFHYYADTAPSAADAAAGLRFTRHFSPKRAAISYAAAAITPCRR